MNKIKVVICCIVTVIYTSVWAAVSLDAVTQGPLWEELKEDEKKEVTEMLQSPKIRAAIAFDLTKHDHSTNRVETYRMAAENGSARDQFLYARSLYYGWGVKKDVKQAFEWTRKSAAQNFPAGLNLLGIMYGAGEGTEKDVIEAAGLLKKAAEMGSVEAIANLARRCYDEGSGVSKDHDKRDRNYRIAAVFGLDYAMIDYAFILWNRKSWNRENDVDKAHKYFEKAKEIGGGRNAFLWAKFIACEARGSEYNPKFKNEAVEAEKFLRILIEEIEGEYEKIIKAEALYALSGLYMSVKNDEMKSWDYCDQAIELGLNAHEWALYVGRNITEETKNELRKRRKSIVFKSTEAKKDEIKKNEKDSFCGFVFGGDIDSYSNVKFEDGAKTDLGTTERRYKMSYLYSDIVNSRPFRYFKKGRLYAGMTTRKVYKIEFYYDFPRNSTVELDKTEFETTLNVLRRKYGVKDAEQTSFSGDKTHTFNKKDFTVTLKWITDKWITEEIIDRGKLVLTATRTDLEKIAEQESQAYYKKRTEDALKDRQTFENDGLDAL